MSDKIELSAVIRSNLFTLSRTTDLIDRTQDRLSTGLKVSSARDDATAFFAARGLSNRADDLNGLKSDIDQGISTIEAAIAGIEAITELVEQAKAKIEADRATEALVAKWKVQLDSRTRELEEVQRKLVPQDLDMLRMGFLLKKIQGQFQVGPT